MYKHLPEPIDILILTNWDWANTGWRYWQAMKTMPSPGPLTIRAYKGKPHSFNYLKQIPIHWDLFNKSYKMTDNGPARHPIIIWAGDSQPLKSLVERAKCIWFQAETFIDTGVDLSNKHVFVTLAGATMREEPVKVSEFFNPIIDKTIVQFPTLMNLGAKNEHLIYYPVDTGFLQATYDRQKKITIGHFPSNPENKGTALIKSVIDKLNGDPKTKGKFEYIGVASTDMRSIRRVDWMDNIDRMRKCDVIIETIQLEIKGKPFGEWGNTALEAAALGKIVITNSLNVDLYNREYGDLALWIANDVEQLEAQLRKAIAMDSNQLFIEKRKMRAWAVKNHSFEATGLRLWERIFKDVFGK